jgi:hypothetical protein
MNKERGTLEPTEFHPSAENALEYMKSLDLQEMSMLLESYSSCAIEGNRLAEVCAETLHRLMTGQPVSDRYLLGLAWNVKLMKERDKK